MQVLFDGGADVNKAANGGGTPACIGVYEGRMGVCRCCSPLNHTALYPHKSFSS